MKHLKRISSFLLINLLIIATISLVLNIFNIQPYLNAKGIQYEQLLIFCLIWGFGGAFISLALSRIMSKWLLGVRVLKPQEANLSDTEKWLLQSTYHYCQKAGLKKMPEVGIFESPEPNAFATGPTKNRALVAVSTGLLTHMNKDEIEGVLAHEVAHIVNGDMVTMTLAQGVVNAFVMFIARVISYFISLNVKEESRPIVNFITTIALEIAFSILAMFAITYLSRKREFKADSGGAKLAGSKKMILALESLKRHSEHKNGLEQQAPSLATLQISGKKNSFLSLLSTHPPLELRIQQLRKLNV